MPLLLNHINTLNIQHLLIKEQEVTYQNDRQDNHQIQHTQ